ncbi:FGGY-family carbohydrate kinase [Vibrio europaeus]|uniref:FGGY-family carbohydrate kinase n=1 Tax=Vibrio europaeus TaxID=300876 RepID=UPI00148C1785|nr:FGGY-family carbohydrate kinase [Vibrio europaeus]NOH23328.1 carbohydrate kinase [Vibrio europaeus]
MSLYALGIDCGNTAVKAALFDQNGTEVAAVANNYPTRIPCPDHTEADLAECWQLCADAIRRVIAAAGIEATQIAALGCSGHGNGVYLLDEQRQPLLAIKSLDNRAEHEVSQFQASKDYQALLRRNRQGVWSSQTAVLLHWLKCHQADVYQNIGQVLFCKDYLNFQLTGECVTEWGDLTASGLFDFESDTVSEELLAAYGITDIKTKLPPIYNSQDVIGAVTPQAAEVTGLAIGTPVIAGMFDVVACAYGSEADSTGSTSVVAGTWNINQVVTDSLPPQEVFMACKMNERQYLAIESSTCSASNLEWLVQRFFTEKQQRAQHAGGSVFEEFNQQLNQLAINAECPMFLPYLYGTTDKQPPMASLLGLKGWHQDIHVVYAFYEGIVFAHLEHISRLRQAGYPIDSIAISGGASRSDYWCQLFADVLNVEVDASKSDEVGARGVAMMALKSVCGAAKPANAASESLTSRHFAPKPERVDFFATRFEKYKVLKGAISTA